MNKKDDSHVITETTLLKNLVELRLMTEYEAFYVEIANIPRESILEAVVEWLTKYAPHIIARFGDTVAVSAALVKLAESCLDANPKIARAFIDAHPDIVRSSYGKQIGSITNERKRAVQKDNIAKANTPEAYEARSEAQKKRRERERLERERNGNNLK